MGDGDTLDPMAPLEPVTHESMADKIINATPITLFNVVWHGTDQELIELLQAIHSSCKTTAKENNLSPDRPCGDLPQSCPMCAAMHDQGVMDRLLYFKRTIHTFGEWEEQMAMDKYALDEEGLDG